MSYLDLLKLASPEAIVALTALVVLVVGLASTRSAGPASAAAVFGIALAIGAVLLLPQQATLFHGMLVITPLTSLFKIICLVLAFFTVILARRSHFTRHHGEYLALLLLATIGLMLLVGSEELLMIFIGLELTGLSLYVLTGFDKTDVRSAEAGLKYFLFGSTASAFTLFGLSFVYGMCGTTGLIAIGEKLSSGPVQPLLAAGIVMTLVGFAFKIAAAPFHLWAPDAYQGAPIPSAAFIASGSKVASFVVLGKIVLIGFGPLHGSAIWHLHDCRLGSRAGRPRRVVDRARESCRTRPNQRPPSAGLLCRGSCGLHFARTRGGRARRIQCDSVLHHDLCVHAGRSVRRCRARPTRNRRRRLQRLFRVAIALAVARRMHGDLYAFPGRPAAARWVFRKILSVQRCDVGRRILACSGSSCWH